MRSVSYSLLWLYVFTVPWDVVPIPGLGTSTRLAGLLVTSAALFTVVAEGRFRKPDAIFGLAIAFTISSALSLLWTISYPDTVEAVWTYAQLLGSLWVAREVARTREQQQTLLIAFCLGAFVPVINLLSHFAAGSEIHRGSGRYSATGFNADGVGLLTAIAIPIAWHLVLTRRGAARVMAVVFLVLAPIVILLTATRGAFLAGLIALTIVPLTVPRRSLRSLLLVTVMVVVTAVSVGSFVPQSTWSRMATIPAEITGGSMSSRRNLWEAGFQAFPDRPLLGVGGGAYGVILRERGQRFLPAHNVFIGVLVEQGVVGLLLFTALVVACFVVIFRMPSSERKLWIVLMLAWGVGLMSLSLERWKVTWLLFALLSAQNGMATARRHARRPDARLVRLGEQAIQS